MKKIVIILDGLGDIKYKQLKNKTPLEFAKTPNLDFLADKGQTGLMYPIKGITPESGEAQFVILGYPLSKYPGRGPLEALSKNIKLKETDIALRANFANIKDNKLLNVRTQPPSKSLLKKINKIHKDIKIYLTTGYRAVMIVKNASLNITNTHPGYKRIKNYSTAVNFKSKILRCKGHKATASKINYFTKQLEKLLKSKTILIRGPGNKLPKLKPLNWNLIADMPVEIGLGKLFKMNIIKRQKNEIQQVINSKKNIYVQIKAPDLPSHLGNLKAKIKAIEKIDKSLAPLKKLKNTITCITADHSTPCKLKRHSNHLVPLLIYGKSQDSVKKFSETACKKGSLGIIQGKQLMNML